ASSDVLTDPATGPSLGESDRMNRVLTWARRIGPGFALAFWLASWAVPARSVPDAPSATAAEGARGPAVPGPEGAGPGASAMPPGASGAGQPVPKVERVQRAPSPSAVTDLSGFVGRRVRANREGYLTPFDIDTYVRMVERRKTREWNWVGEQ